jgi:YaiO family outer membrane protein
MNFKISLLLIVLVWTFQQGMAQEKKKLNADVEFENARKLASEKQYREAINLAYQILEQYPDYTDVRIFAGRVNAWNHNFSEAETQLKKVLAAKPDNLEATLALADIYIWSNRPVEAISVCETGLNVHPLNSELLMKKAQAEYKIQEYDLSKTSLNKVLEIDPQNQQASNLLKEVNSDNWKNKIETEYYYENFKKPYIRHWHLSTLSYGRRTKLGMIYGRMYWGDLVQDGEKWYGAGVSRQFAIEAYPRISQKKYLFLNYSFSGEDNFPKTRFGVEVYQGLPHAFELSAGYRYMDFSQTNATSRKINIYTGSVGKYQGSYWLSFRPFLIDNGNDFSTKLSLTIRKYLSRDDSYLSLCAGTGTSPDNPAIYTVEYDRYVLKSRNIQIGWKQRVGSHFQFDVAAGYEKAQYRQNMWRDEFITRAALAYLFK